MLCLAYGVGGVLYSGTLSGDIYKWQGNELIENISGAHAVGDSMKQFSHNSFGYAIIHRLAFILMFMVTTFFSL